MPKGWMAALVLSLGVFTSTHIFAQTSNATVGGTVTDATTALIPGVTVTVRNVGTGIVNETFSNETGNYQFPNLQTGTYEVSAELPGFQTARYTNVVLGGGQQVRLNFTLAVAAAATAVEVVAVADTALATTSASIESVLPDLQLRALPTGDRNILELLRGMAGTGPLESYRHDGVGRNPAEGNFAGGRIRDTNVTRDGFNVSAGRYDQGTFSVTYTSSDLVEEVRITTGTVDAEAGRGSGQVAMVTRSGTNDFRGSAFWNNRNSALDAAHWFNNFRGIKADWENRNQFGARLGGPIIGNKTFFFVLVDEQRWVARQNVIGTVFTNEARQGIFRYFPGADNENVLQNNPVVDRLGNAIRPSRATGDLQSINLFARDPFRPGYDPTGWIQNVLLARMPPPNDFTVGDGLNTAGIRFTRRVSGTDHGDGQRYDTNNRDQFNLRLDHNFTSANKISFVYTYERSLNDTEWQSLPQWPNGIPGAQHKRPKLATFSLVSTPTPNVVNDLRVGYRVADIDVWAPWYIGRDRDDESTMTDKARETLKIWPTSNAIPYQVVPLAFFPIGFMQFNANFGTTRGAYSPMLMYGDTLSWTKGRHAFKTGVEFRRDRTDGWNDNNLTPFVQLGEGNTPAPINTITIPGLSATNAARARDLVYTLAGSIDFVRQGFDMTSPKSGLLGYQDGVKLKRRDWRANEFSAFFKDQWRVTPNLTLNLGLAWDWYGVPYEARGLTGWERIRRSRTRSSTTTTGTILARPWASVTNSPGLTGQRSCVAATASATLARRSKARWAQAVSTAARGRFRACPASWAAAD
ncbi:MAG: TonB-dependent receptor [Acidobacteria bacterium]|nr:TonB-dependent receptor [Acidobacteriota bacterium]